MFEFRNVVYSVCSAVLVGIIFAVAKLFIDVSTLKVSKTNHDESIKNIDMELLSLKEEYKTELNKTEERLEKAIRILDEKIESNKEDMKDGFKDLKKDIRDLQNLIQQALLRKE